MKKRIFVKLIITAVLSMSLMAGCGEKSAEAKATYRQMGIEYMEKGDYAAAIEAFNAALSQEVGTIGVDELDITYYKAAAQYAGGDVEAAMATYNAILDFDKEAYQAYYLRGCLYCKQVNGEAAKADFSNAVKYRSGDYSMYINIYENLLSMGEKEAGESYLTEALSIKGEEVTNLEYRGQIRYLLGDYDTAVLDLKAALQKGSTYANLYLAKAYEDMGDSALAQEHLKTYIASAPADAVALNELGEIMLGKAMYAEAVLYFEQGLECELVPNRGAIMHNLVAAYEYNGQFDKAWELIQEYVVLFPEDAKAQREYIFLKNRQMKEENTEETEVAESTEATS